MSKALGRQSVTVLTRDTLTLDIDPSSRGKIAIIASVSDQEWHISRTYGMFHIPACAKGESCSLLEVKSRSDVIDLGDNHRLPFAISARDIAEDLIQDLREHGLFVCAGEHPNDDELTRARARRDSWYKQLIAEADEMWARGHSYREISDMHRRAATAMGLAREWAYVPQRQMECPACGEKLKPGVAICKHCHAILDSERGTRYGLGKSAEAGAPGTHHAASHEGSVPRRKVNEP
jgi:hypothetical protein